MSWIGKLLGGGDGRKPVSPATIAQAGGEGAPGAGDPRAAAPPDGESDDVARTVTDGADAPYVATALEVDAAWYRWVAAGGMLPARSGVEAHLLDQMAQLTASPSAGAAMVPRVPELIPRLLRLLLEDDMNVAALARALAGDPVLVAELYREANRPFYRPRYHSGPPVSSIDGAIMLLGQNGMRMLLMRIALRPILSMQNGRLARRTAPLLWRQSEKCALAAGNLAPVMRALAFETYLAGLMQNVGLIVAFRLLDEMALDDALPQSEEFIAALFAQGRQLSARIATLWEFPEAVAAAIASDDPEDPEARVLALADRLAKLRMLVDSGRFAADDPFVTAGLNPLELANLERLRDEDEE